MCWIKRTKRLIRFISLFQLSIIISFVWIFSVSVCAEQTDNPALPAVDLPDEPVVVDTAEMQIRVEIITEKLSHPWGLAFLPDGGILVTERDGRLRLVRGDRLSDEVIKGLPQVHAVGVAGLMDIALHPLFRENRWLYFTYSKPDADEVRVALGRGRLKGMSLSNVEDLFLSDILGGSGAAASRIVFGKDGSLYMTVGGAFGEEFGKRAQDLTDTVGKVIRLNDDGSIPEDNPFAGQHNAKAEIYSLGHRNQLGLAINPETGEVWANENGPLGGDEINVITAGGNYGWPLVSYSRYYSGPRVASRSWQQGMEEAEIVWLPSIAPSGMTFVTSDLFPQWKNNVFVGSLRTGMIRNTGHLERIVFNDDGQEQHREWILSEFRQRIRDVRQGPDGLLYVLTDADDAALLRLSPAQ